MIKNNSNAQAYKAPVCKLVRVHAQSCLMVVSNPYGDSGSAANGYDGDNTTEYESDF